MKIWEVYNPEKGPQPTVLEPWSDFSLQNCEIQVSVVYKAPSLWYFVVAASTD